MCLANNRYPAERVSFLDTILYGAEVRNPSTGAVQHVLGYYNKVNVGGSAVSAPVRRSRSSRSDDDFGWEAPPQAVGNAMIFAVPAAKGTLNKDSLVPVSAYPVFMQDYKVAVAPQTLGRGPARRGRGARSIDAPVEVVKGFDGGLYDVLISTSPQAIIKAIPQVDEAKRPTINRTLYSELKTACPGFTFVLFCFSEADANKGGCAMIKYTPMPGYENLLYLPGLDGHNGRIERGEVELNHTLVVGSYRMDETAGADRVSFRDAALRASDPRPYEFLDRVVGKVIPSGTKAPQGDFLFNLAQVRKGQFKALRAVPPGFKKLKGAQVSDSKYYIE